MKNYGIEILSCMLITANSQLCSLNSTKKYMGSWRVHCWVKYLLKLSLQTERFKLWDTYKHYSVKGQGKMGRYTCHYGGLAAEYFKEAGLSCEWRYSKVVKRFYEWFSCKWFSTQNFGSTIQGPSLYLVTKLPRYQNNTTMLPRYQI